MCKKKNSESEKEKKRKIINAIFTQCQSVT